MSDDSEIAKNVMIFRVDNSSFTHPNKRKKDILIHGKDPSNRLYDTAIAAEAVYSISFR